MPGEPEISPLTPIGAKVANFLSVSIHGGPPIQRIPPGPAICTRDADAGGSGGTMVATNPHGRA